MSKTRNVFQGQTKVKCPQGAKWKNIYMPKLLVAWNMVHPISFKFSSLYQLAIECFYISCFLIYIFFFCFQENPIRTGMKKISILERAFKNLRTSFDLKLMILYLFLFFEKKYSAITHEIFTCRIRQWNTRQSKDIVLKDLLENKLLLDGTGKY